MATKKEAAEEAALDEPKPKLKAKAGTIEAEMEQMEKDQEASRAAYRDSPRNEPSL